MIAKNNFFKKQMEEGLVGDTSHPIEDFGIKGYQHYLDLQPEEVENKVVVDIGAGVGNFGQQVVRSKDWQPKEVYSIEASPLVQQGEWEIEPGHRRMTARAERLPLEDGEADIILMFRSAMNYAQTEEGIEKIFSEIMRSLKEDGQARLGPMWWQPEMKKWFVGREKVDDDFYKINDKIYQILEEIKQQGHQVSIEIIDEEAGVGYIKIIKKEQKNE